MNRKDHPIVSVQLHPNMLEQIDSYSRNQYSSRSEVIRNVLTKWCIEEKNRIEEPPLFACSG
jgi:metal-responsive CopG/Arc/MetJ family transcriptional regulator